MIRQVMVGASKLSQSGAFYDATLSHVGLVIAEKTETYIGYLTKKNKNDIVCYVTIPENAKAATCGNETMITIKGGSINGRFTSV